MTNNFLNKHVVEDINFYLKFKLNVDKEIKFGKVLFIKSYSKKTIKVINWIIKRKLYFFTNIFDSDDIEYIDEENSLLFRIDVLKLYYFVDNENFKYYMLVSEKWNINNIDIKEDKVELFAHK